MLVAEIKRLSSLFFWRTSKHDISDLLWDPFEAVAEINRRRQDPLLLKRIEDYLDGDIPDYFRDGPIMHLARHVVTPNFETLRFLYLTKHLGLRTVISHDSRGLFVSQNLVKRALCKMPICRRLTQRGGKLNEQYENVSIVNFNTIDGRTFDEIRTVWGESLIDFHTNLFCELGFPSIDTPDDADWLDRHHRDNLYEHYKQLLLLFVAHGIFFENYNTQDEHELLFVESVLRPVCKWVEKEFGFKPLIVPIFPTTFESYQFWISYPRKTIDIVHEKLKGRGVVAEMGATITR